MKTHFALKLKLTATTASDFKQSRSRRFYLMNTTFLKTTVLFALSVLLALTTLASPPPATNYCGPIYPPPLGVTFSSSGSGIGRSGGITWDFQSTVLANSTTVFWGAKTNDGALGGVKLSFDDGQNYGGAEIMTYSSSLTTSAGGLANGYVVWSGQTQFPDGTPVYTHCTMHVTLSGGGNVALTSASSLGLPTDIGGVVPVTSSSMHWQANILFEASFSSGSGFSPALNFYDDVNNAYHRYNSGGTAGSSFGAGFEYVNPPPTITSIANVSTKAGTAVGPLSFTVGDLLTAAGSLTVTAVSSNQSVVTNTSITLGGSGASRTISLATSNVVGNTTVTVTVNDGNCAYYTNSTSFVLTTTNANPPTITLPVSPVVAEATSASGAPVTFSVTANDSIDGAITPTVTPISGSTFAIGNTTVNVAVTNSSGLSTNGSFTVTVHDTTAPVIAAHGNVTAQTTNASGIVVTYTNALATDAVGVTSLTYSRNSGLNFPVGTTIVTNTASDAAGNVSHSTFTVSVTLIDYIIATTGGVITVTNNSGNADALTVTEPSAGNIQFNATGRAFSVDGATFTANNSGPISLTGISNIVINAGADSISVGTFSVSLPNMNNTAANYTAAADIAIQTGDTLTLNVSGASTISGAISGTNTALIKTGAGTLTLSGNNTFSGATVISQGTLKLQGQPSGTVALYQFNNSGNLGLDSSSQGNNLVTGTGNPAYSSAGKYGGALYLDGSSTLTKASFPTGVPTGSSPYTVAAWVKADTGCDSQGGWLGYGSNGSSLGNNFRLNGAGNNMWEYWYANDMGATLPSGTFFDGYHSVVGTWDGTTEKIYLDGILSASRVPSPPSITSASFFIGKNLNSPNFTGWVDDLLIVKRALSQTEIQAVMNGVGNPLPSTTTVQIASGATLDLNGANQTIASLGDSNGGGGTVTNSANVPSLLTINVPSGSTNFSGTIRDNGSANAISLLKIGAGTQIFSGANTYTGTNSVTGGKLVVNGSLAASGSLFSVNGTGTLGGTGTVSQVIAVNGGSIAPGNSPGILNVTNLSFDSSSTYSIDINGTTVGTDYDQLNVTGTVALNNATLAISATYTPANSDAFVIVNNDGTDAITGTFNGLPEGSAVTINGVQKFITYVGGTGNDVVLGSPDIGVQQPVGTALTDGASSIDFGNQLVSTTSAATTFTITNLGSVTLILTNISVDGANAGDFAVSALGSTSVAIGGSTTFTVTFTPTASGSRNAALHITNNESGAKNPFDIALTGNGTLPGAALALDGADDYLNIDGVRSSVSGAAKLTIEMWVKPGALSGLPVLWSGDSGDYIQTDTANILYLAFGGAGHDTLRINNFFTPGVWQHIALVFDGSQPAANRWSAYKNGSLVSSSGSGNMTATIPSLTGPMLLGAYSGGGYNYAGSMDEVRIWNRALNACEIQAHKDCELSGTENGLVAYYKFNQGIAGMNNSGVTTLTDSGPNGFNGTLNNFALTGATSNWQTPGGVTTGNACSPYTAPEIDVQGGSPLTSIVAGDVTPTIAKGTEFGTNLISSSVVKTFTITNSGTAALNISSLSKSGANSADFTLGALTPASPIAVNGSATFTVTFTPSATGLRSATVTIANDDCVEGSYAIAVQGTGNTRPSLMFPASPVIAEATSASGAVVTFAVTANDVEDGTLTPTVTPASGSTFAIGNTTVNVSATDSSGVTTNTSFTVTVQDTTAPTISTHGNVIAEATGASGAVVTYTNATATDLVGVTAITYSQNSGTLFPIGVTTVTIYASDAAHNTNTSTFTVTVQDTTAPSISTHGNLIAEATSASGAVVTYTNATATDLVGVTAITYSQNSGTLFPIGVTTVTIYASDAAHNTNTSTFTVTVQDTTAPTISTHGNLIAEATSASGAVVAYTNATATDLVGVTAITYSQNSGTTFPIGVTTVTVYASDAAHNTNTSTFTVTVQDTTAPVVAAHADVTVAATSTNGAVVTYAAGSATDAVGVTSITYSQNSGTTFPIGLTTVTISAKDAANNTGTTTFNVRVIDFSGDVAQFRQCWRGLPNSTFQQWAFSVANDPSSVPAERVTNSFGTPTASLALGAFSEGYIDADPYFGPVQGIWDLGQYGTLTLNIPNQSGASTNSCKYVQVQVTQYKDGSI